MKLLVIGRGAREHALIWKISQNPRVKKIYSATGNAGISELAEQVNIRAEEVKKLADFAEKKKIDITVVGGPEVAFTEGIVDEFKKRGLNILGPTREVARLEASKTFAKEFMKKYGIPTARFGSFCDEKEAFEYIERMGPPFAVKADGLTQDKGFIIARDKATAKVAVHVILKDQEFGEAGNRVIIEELLKGVETTVLAFTDGKTIVPMGTSHYYPSAYDGNLGPVTGGMGAVSPCPVVSDSMLKKIEEDILKPCIKAMQKEKLNYKGVFCVKLIITDDGPRVVDFHVRFGDPEVQVTLPRLKTDIVEIFEAIIKEKLDKIELKWDDRYALGVVLVSSGYPMKYSINKEITGYKKIKTDDSLLVFHAATAKKKRKLFTSGGRVFNIIGLGKDFSEAADRVYSMVDKIEYAGKYFRRDIGTQTLKLQAMKQFKV